MCCSCRLGLTSQAAAGAGSGGGGLALGVVVDQQLLVDLRHAVGTQDRVLLDAGDVDVVVAGVLADAGDACVHRDDLGDIVHLGQAGHVRDGDPMRPHVAEQRADVVGVVRQQRDVVLLGLLRQEHGRRGQQVLLVVELLDLGMVDDGLGHVFAVDEAEELADAATILAVDGQGDHRGLAGEGVGLDGCRDSGQQDGSDCEADLLLVHVH